jgi:hypothetical protein
MKMFKYNVYGETATANVMANSSDARQVSDLYEMMHNDDSYLMGRITDNETGEVYCYFYKEQDAAGTTTTEWVAN